MCSTERKELKEDDKKDSKKQNKIIKRKRNSDSLERQFWYSRLAAD
jgi:hypothetical protein